MIFQTAAVCYVNASLYYVIQARMYVAKQFQIIIGLLIAMLVL